jgi:hypothetical protein
MRVLVLLTSFALLHKKRRKRKKDKEKK